MSLRSSVTQLVDDCWEEDSEPGVWQGYRVKAGTVESNFWVPECVNHTVPSERFVPESVAIFLESCDNTFPFLGSQELGGRGIVVDQEEVRKTGEGDGEEPLL